MDLDRRVLEALGEIGKSESELAADLGVDVASIRDSCRRLHRDWLVTTNRSSVATQESTEPRFRITEHGQRRAAGK
jgi:DNA-binding MarR family transcriptional regulator